jgi:hypothetical protein
MNIPIQSHAFEKANLVTISSKQGSYDLYICAECGLTGKRFGLTDNITILKNHKALAVCSNAPLPEKVMPEGWVRPIKVVVVGAYAIRTFGFEPNKIYDVVDATDSRFVDDVWVYSEVRKEPIRLLADEYTKYE